MAIKISALTAVAAAAGANEFPVNEAGTTKKVTITQVQTLLFDGAVTINDSGANVDMRVEGDTDANVLFVDASADSVGIGTATPGSKLEIATQNVSNNLKLSEWNTAGGTAAELIFNRARSGAIGTHGALNAGDVVGGVYFRGDGSAGNGQGMASIKAVVEGITGGRNDGYMQFLTAEAGSSSTPAERVRISSTGLVGINRTAPGAQLHVVAKTASTIGQIITLAATPTANAFEVNSSAGSGGDLWHVTPTGRIRGPSGSGSVPSIGFTADDSGMYRASGQLGFTVDAIPALLLGAFGTTVIIQQDAVLNWSNSNTDVATVGDTNIYRAAAAQVGIVNGIIVNDAGADVDSRMEGDTDANLFYLDASTDRIGIGTATPAVKLDVVGTVAASTGVKIGGGTTIAKVMSATATLNFGSTAAGAVSDLTVTVTGAADGDVVSVGAPNGSITATGMFFGWVSAADTVTVRFLHNHLVNAEDPASGTFRVTVTQF